MRVALRFAYDGSAFPNGYARQPEGGTVEDALITACRREGYVDGSWITGSRTDKGVSAAENVAACDLDRPHIKGLVPALQSHLPEGLWVTGAAVVAADWTPRFDAVRTYQYVVRHQGESLDAMQRGCDRFEGTHDMSAFAKVEPPRDPKRIITACRVDLDSDTLRFTVASPGFLWNQVRRMVDALLCVGRGDATPADIEASLDSGKAHSKFDLAPPDGLLLVSVRYDPELDWDEAAGVLDARRLRAAWQKNRVMEDMLERIQVPS